MNRRPYLWLVVGTPAEAANTLDAMFGHRSERYAAFGWAAGLFAVGLLVAVFILPRDGAARTRALSTTRPSARRSIPSIASRPPRGVSRTSTITPSAE